ncbi:hypothetical protein ABZW49_28260 [Nonomuraea wenchangensis]
MTTNGVVLSVVEHPGSWHPARQMAVVDDLLKLLGLVDRRLVVPVVSGSPGRNS